MSAVRVSIPASTANLGPGFDCLGLALELRNEVEMSEAPGWHAESEGEGAEALPRDASNLILRSARALLEEAGRSAEGVRVRALNRIPLAAGLGSSSTATVAGIAAANRLFGLGWEPPALLALAARIEGHADNVAPALLGGLTLVARGDDGRPLVRQVALPPLRVVVATPEFGLSTAETRAALPREVPLADAVFNIGRSLLVVEALRAADFDLLGRALADRLHQPLRAARIPGFDEVAAAAREAGAAAVALSGAGPSLAAFAADGHTAVGAAMVSAWQRRGVRARAFVLDATQRGVAFA